MVDVCGCVRSSPVARFDYPMAVSTPEGLWGSPRSLGNHLLEWPNRIKCLKSFIVKDMHLDNHFENAKFKFCRKVTKVTKVSIREEPPLHLEHHLRDDVLSVCHCMSVKVMENRRG